MSDRLTIHLQQTHTCGHQYEQIIHVKEADFSLDAPPFPLVTDLSLPFTLPTIQRDIKVQFTGIAEKLEINGLEWKQYNLVCPQCGASLLFPGKVSE